MNNDNLIFKPLDGSEKSSDIKNFLYAFDIQKLEHLYDSTIGIHQQKNQKIQNILNSLQSNFNHRMVSFEYLETYFSNVVDLLFSFNSFLINAVSFFKDNTQEQKDVSNVFKKFQIFNLDNKNFNSLEDLSKSYTEVIKLSNIDISDSIAKRIRIYEVLFRHFYAHGNLVNLIHYLILHGSSSLLYVSLNENMPENARLRILLEKKEYFRFIKDIEIFDNIEKLKLNQKITKACPELIDNAYEIKTIDWNNEKHFYLTEDVSRMYLKWYGHNMLMKPNFSASIDSMFISNFSGDVKKLNFGLQNNKEDPLMYPRHYIDYSSIKEDIDKFSKLIFEFAKILLIKNHIRYIFKEHESMELTEIVKLHCSSSYIEKMMEENFNYLKVEIFKNTYKNKEFQQIIYSKL